MIEAGSGAELNALGWAMRVYDIMADDYTFLLGGGRSVRMKAHQISGIRTDTWKPHSSPAMVVYSVPDIEQAAAEVQA